MSNINRIGCELSKSARHDLRRAIRCMLIAASTLPLVYSGLTMGQESPYPPTNMGRVTVTADRYVPEPIITLATVRAVAFNPNSVSFYVDGVRMGDTFLGPVDTAGYDDGGNQGPVQQRNPQPDKPSCDGGGSKVGAMHAQVQNNPVDVTNGLKHVQETDFQSISNPELKLARYKNPLWKGSGILGQGWVTNLDLKLSFAGESGTCYPTPGAASCNVKNPSIISLYTEQGGIVQFTGGSGGYWQASNGSSISLVDGGKYRVRLRDSIFTPTMLFHSNGFVERVEQRDGNRLDFTYNSNKLTRVTHTSGRYIELRWSATTPSVVTTVVAPNNASFNYEYYYTGTRYASGLDSPILKRVSFPDGKGNVEYVHEEGYHTIHGAPQAYVHLHKILQVKVNGVALKKYTYHISGKVASSSFSDGSNLISYAYLSGKTESLNPYGKKTTYTISNDKITEVAGAASANCSATASFTSYNSNGQLEYTVDQSDVITRYEYDAYGRKKKQVEAAGTPEQRITTWEWDSDSANIFRTNLLKKMTVAGLVETSYEYLVGTIYDSAMPSAVVVKNLSANGVPSETRRTTYSYTFHSNGMVATVTEDGPMPGGGDAVVTSYNSSGDIISVQNSLGHRRVFSGHNGFGQPAKITNENGDATEYDYDARGRITTVREVVNGSPQSTVFSHDQFGRLNRIVAPDGRTFVREFDAAWRLIREYESESQGTYAQTRYSYDQASNVTSIVKERTTAVNPPAATPALTVPGVGVNGSFTISWTAVSGSESYTLEQSAAGGAWSSVYSGTSRSKSFSGMSAGSYAYRVKACNVAGCSAVSASGVVRIVYKPTASPVLTAPSQVTTGIYVVSWTSISGATSYNLEESTNNGAWSLIQNSALRTKSITGKTAATYRYRVAACNEAGCGPISAVATVLEVDPPTAIPIFTATPIVNTSGSYSIKWSSVSGAGSYMLEESAGGGAWVSVHNAADISKAFSGKSTSIPHAYRVKACNVAGCGGYSAIATVQKIIYGADFISQSVPSIMTAGKLHNVTVTMKNTGNTTWYDVDGYRLGSQNPGDNIIWGRHRVAVPAAVPPGANVSFTFSAAAPANAGTYNFQWRMVRDGHAWFGTTSPNVSVGVASGSISANPNPCAMYIGETSCTSRISWQSSRSDAQVWVTNIDNSGSQLFAAGKSGAQSATWIPQSGKRFHLKASGTTLATVDVYGYQTNQYPEIPEPPEPECPEYQQCDIR